MRRAVMRRAVMRRGVTRTRTRTCLGGIDIRRAADLGGWRGVGIGEVRLDVKHGSAVDEICVCAGAERSQ